MLAAFLDPATIISVLIESYNNRTRHLQAEHASRLRSQPGAERPLLAPAALGCLAAVAALPLLALPAAALGLHAEPQNALSLPTWAIHVSSVLEWTAAMALVWRYADASGASAVCGMLLLSRNANTPSRPMTGTAAASCHSARRSVPHILKLNFPAPLQASRAGRG